MQTDFAGKPEVQPVVEYMQSLQYFRHEGTERAVALEYFDNLKLTYEQVPAEILCHKWIWPGLVPLLPLPTLLSNIKRLGHMRLLNENQPLEDVVIGALANPEILGRNRVTPADVLVTLCKYQNLTK